MTSARQVRELLVRAAHRFSRVDHEVEDVAHDLVVAALRRGLPLDGAFLQSAHGAARRHGAFLARSAGRRRKRENDCARLHPPEQDVPDAFDPVDGDSLSRLSTPLRTTLLLLLLGLDKAELRQVLGINDSALRKRFQELRKRAPLVRPHLLLPDRTPPLSQVRRSQVTLVPRLAAIAAGVQPGPRVLATGDPDGHGMIFLGGALTPGALAATAPTTGPDARAKGPPCSIPTSRTSASSSR